MPELSKTAPETISEAYYSLTAAEKRCADYVLAHQQEAQFLSITELAEVSNVAEATVSRFCRRLGYRGYKSFKLALANAAAQLGAWGNPLSGEVTKEDSLEDVCRKLQAVDTAAISQTLEMIRPDQMRKAAKMLRGAKRVLCMGQGGSMLIAEEAAHLFSTVGGKYQAVRDSHMQAIATVNADPEDVILYFSYSGSTVDMMHTLGIARKNGAGVVLITRFPKSPGAELADAVLQCGADESPLQLGSVAAKIAQMYLLDVLFSEVCREDLENARRSRQRIADALSEKHL